MKPGLCRKTGYSLRNTFRMAIKCAVLICTFLFIGLINNKDKVDAIGTLNGTNGFSCSVSSGGKINGAFDLYECTLTSSTGIDGRQTIGTVFSGVSSAYIVSVYGYTDSTFNTSTRVTYLKDKTISATNYLNIAFDNYPGATNAFDSVEYSGSNLAAPQCVSVKSGSDCYIINFNHATKDEDGDGVAQMFEYKYYAILVGYDPYYSNSDWFYFTVKLQNKATVSSLKLTKATNLSGTADGYVWPTKDANGNSVSMNLTGSFAANAMEFEAKLNSRGAAYAYNFNGQGVVRIQNPAETVLTLKNTTTYSGISTRTFNLKLYSYDGTVYTSSVTVNMSSAEISSSSGMVCNGYDTQWTCTINDISANPTMKVILAPSITHSKIVSSVTYDNLSKNNETNVTITNTSSWRATLNVTFKNAPSSNSVVASFTKNVGTIDYNDAFNIESSADLIRLANKTIVFCAQSNADGYNTCININMKIGNISSASTSKPVALFSTTNIDADTKGQYMMRIGNISSALLKGVVRQKITFNDNTSGTQTVCYNEKTRLATIQFACDGYSGLSNVTASVSLTYADGKVYTNDKVAIFMLSGSAVEENGGIYTNSDRVRSIRAKYSSNISLTGRNYYCWGASKGSCYNNTYLNLAYTVETTTLGYGWYYDMTTFAQETSNGEYYLEFYLNSAGFAFSVRYVIVIDNTKPKVELSVNHDEKGGWLSDDTFVVDTKVSKLNYKISDNNLLYDDNAYTYCWSEKNGTNCAYADVMSITNTTSTVVEATIPLPARGNEGKWTLFIVTDIDMAGNSAFTGYDYNNRKLIKYAEVVVDIAPQITVSQVKAITGFDGKIIPDLEYESMHSVYYGQPGATVQIKWEDTGTYLITDSKTTSAYQYCWGRSVSDENFICYEGTDFLSITSYQTRTSELVIGNITVPTSEGDWLLMLKEPRHDGYLYAEATTYTSLFDYVYTGTGYTYYTFLFRIDGTAPVLGELEISWIENMQTEGNYATGIQGLADPFYGMIINPWFIGAGASYMAAAETIIDINYPFEYISSASTLQNSLSYRGFAPTMQSVCVDGYYTSSGGCEDQYELKVSGEVDYLFLDTSVSGARAIILYFYDEAGNVATFDSSYSCMPSWSGGEDHCKTLTHEQMLIDDYDGGNDSIQFRGTATLPVFTVVIDNESPEILIDDGIEIHRGKTFGSNVIPYGSFDIYVDPDDEIEIFCGDYLTDYSYVDCEGYYYIDYQYIDMVNDSTATRKNGWNRLYFSGVGLHTVFNTTYYDESQNVASQDYYIYAFILKDAVGGYSDSFGNSGILGDDVTVNIDGTGVECVATVFHVFPSVSEIPYIPEVEIPEPNPEEPSPEPTPTPSPCANGSGVVCKLQDGKYLVITISQNNNEYTLGDLVEGAGYTLLTVYSSDGEEIKDNGQYSSSINKIIVKTEGSLYIVEMYVLYNTPIAIFPESETGGNSPAVVKQGEEISNIGASFVSRTSGGVTVDTVITKDGVRVKNINTNIPGVYTMTQVAKDTRGRTTKVERTVIVEENEIVQEEIVEEEIVEQEDIVVPVNVVNHEVENNQESKKVELNESNVVKTLEKKVKVNGYKKKKKIKSNKKEQFTFKLFSKYFFKIYDG